jgi:hypothetical protein
MNDNEEEITVRKCCECNETIEGYRCALNNLANAGFPDKKTFIFMDSQESIHFECYIQRIIEHFLKRNEEK